MRHYFLDRDIGVNGLDGPRKIVDSDIGTDREGRRIFRPLRSSLFFDRLSTVSTACLVLPKP